MEVFHIWRGTKGFVSLYNYALRFRYMITEEAKKRIKILTFWERYGDEAVKEAFGVSRRTLFRWQQALKQCHGKLEALNIKSCAPQRRRRRHTPPVLEKQIITLRIEHPRLGIHNQYPPSVEYSMI